MINRNNHIRITERVSTRLRLKQLRLLVAIDKHRSILHASGQLNISQPAATKLLKDLELDFGVQLFDRTNRGVIPTEFGDALVRHGKLILAQVSHAAQELDDLNSGLGGRVVLGTLLTASAKLLPDTICRIHQSRPDVSIVVRDGTNDFLMPLLHTGDLDMVVGRMTEYRHRVNVTQEVLYQEQMVLVGRKDHPLSRQQKISFEQIADQDWILPPVQTTLRRQIEKEFSDRGHASPSNAVESISYLTNRALITSTDMICMLPFDVASHEIANGDFTLIKCKLGVSSGPVGVTYRNLDALSPASIAFLQELRTQAKTMPDPKT